MCKIKSLFHPRYCFLFVAKLYQYDFSRWHLLPYGCSKTRCSPLLINPKQFREIFLSGIVWTRSSSLRILYLKWQQCNFQFITDTVVCVCVMGNSCRIKLAVESMRRKVCTGRQPIVNRVVARKATDWSKFCKRCETGNSIGLYSVAECTRKPLMQFKELVTHLATTYLVESLWYTYREKNWVFSEDNMQYICSLYSGLGSNWMFIGHNDDRPSLWITNFMSWKEQHHVKWKTLTSQWI